MSNIGAIVLAAGGSARLGVPKQLLPYGATTLLGKAIEAAVASNCHPAILVLGAYAETIRAKVSVPNTCQTVINEQWQTGIASSIRLGLSDLLQVEPNIEAVVFLLCDQPHVSSEVLNSLISTFRSSTSAIVASSYGGTVGVPALFERRFFGELESLTGDNGAKRVIRNHASQLATVDFQGGSYDVDTQDEYRRLLVPVEF